MSKTLKVALYGGNVHPWMACTQDGDVYKGQSRAEVEATVVAGHPGRQIEFHLCASIWAAIDDPRLR